jgi:uncharacterized membrane protein YphA (DoxX/SURF4 family)
MNFVILLVRLLLCLVFLIAGLAKLAGSQQVLCDLGCLPPLSVEEMAVVSHFNFLSTRGPTGPVLRQEQPGVAVPGVEKMD